VTQLQKGTQWKMPEMSRMLSGVRVENQRPSLFETFKRNRGQMNQ
jgi:hypothetical protein